MSRTFSGLKIRTTNAYNASERDIGDLWNTFSKEKHYDTLSEGAKNNCTYGIYTNYDGEYYDFYLGREMNFSRSGYETVYADEYNFKEFEFDFYKPEDALEAWKKIWADTSLNRKYSIDIEEYDAERKKLKIYISIN